MQVAVFHPGTQHSWQTALALQEMGRLAWYATSIFYKPDEFPYRLERILPGAIGRRLHQEFRRFSHPGLDPARVRTVGLIEWLERISERGGLRELAQWINVIGNRRFVNSIAKDIRSPDKFALWGYSGSSLTSFELAQQQGRACILDRTNGDFGIYNDMMAEIRESYGDWFLAADQEVPTATIATDRREYELADTILVGSPFAAGTVRAAVPDPAIHAKLRVLNYCYDEALFSRLPQPRASAANGPVKFLFLGLAVPRKGIHLVLEAIAQLPSSAATLTIVGDLRIPAQAFSPYADRVTYLPTVARADVPAIMAAHDVLLLPSYFEGAGIVLYEALAAGCALIQSDRCAPAVTPQTGIMLDRPDTNELLRAMTIAIEDRAQLSSWRAAAQIEARNYSFAKYRENIRQMLNELLS